MVQGKKQLNSKPKFAEVVIGDNEAKEMRGYGSHHLCNRQKGSRYALCHRLSQASEGTRLGAISPV